MTSGRLPDDAAAPDGADAGPARVVLLVADDTTRDLLAEWFEARDAYDPVTGGSVASASADLCLVDAGALERHEDALRDRKRRERPVLLPTLFLLPKASADPIADEYSHRLDPGAESVVDEVLTLPIRWGELEWRVESLLAMRSRTRELAASEHELRQFGRAVEAAGHAIYITDTSGTIRYANPQFEATTGYAPSEAVGETPELFHSGEMSDEYYADLWDTIESGRVWEEEIVNRREDGELYDAHQTIAPVPDQDGEIEGYVAIQTDVTERTDLEDTLRQYRQAIESSTELLAAIDESGYRFANDTYREYYGLGDAAVAGRPLESVLDPETSERVADRVERVLDGETVRFETELTHPERGRRVLEGLSYPLRDDGTVRGVIDSLRDVTGRREGARRNETIVSNLPGIVYRCENAAGWPMEFVAGQVEAVTGYTAEQLESGEVSWGEDVVHPAERERVAEQVVDAVAADESFGLTYRIQTASGETRWVWERGREVTPLTADRSMLSGFVMDVTDRKARAAELRQKSRAMDEAPIGITVSDPGRPDNPMTYVNDGFVELTGYEAVEAVGRNCRFLQGENTDPETVATLRRAIEAEEPVSAVIRNYRADGTEFWNALEIAPVRDDDGEVTNFIGFQQDVTERVERQRQLQKIDRVLRHNLRNDLNVVLGTADRIRRQTEPPVTEHAARIIETSDALLDTMEKSREITQLLEEPPSVEPVDLMEALRPLGDRCREAYPSATVRIDGPESVGVVATAELRTALAELLGNALEHSDRDAPAVDVGVRVDEETVTVDVTDDGPGIPEVEVDILTGAVEVTPLYHGEGLGLWLVHLIVRRSGGTVAFSEADPRGNIVSVTLDRASLCRSEPPDDRDAEDGHRREQ